MVENPEAGIAGILKFLGKDETAYSLSEIAQKTQVSLKPGEAPRDGNHIRTAGRSVAAEEIPEALFLEFQEMEARLSESVEN